MRIAIGADHAGFLLKERVRNILQEKGHVLNDFTPEEIATDDYPDYAGPVGEAVAHGEADRGVLICWTGAGMSISANKIKGIRAALAVDEEGVRLARQHNNVNVLTLGARNTDPALAEKLIDVFLATEFEGGRHERRVGKITALEADPVGTESQKENKS